MGCSRSHPQAAAAPQPPPVEFLGQWGVHGDGPGQLDDPVGPAVDAIGRVYFCRPGHGIRGEIELSGVPLLSFQNGSLRGATGIAVDSGGAIYVANARAGDIQVFFPEGQLLRVFRMTPQHNFEGLFGFSVDDLGKTFVPDPAGGRVQVISPVGRLEKVWKISSGSASAGARPVAAIAGPDGFVYVADAWANRIVKYTNMGAEVTAWQDPAGAGVPLLGLAVSGRYVFALHSASPRLVVWTVDGRLELSDNLAGQQVRHITRRLVVHHLLSVLAAI